MNTTHPVLAWLYKHGWLPDRRAIKRLEYEAAWTEGYRAAILEQRREMEEGSALRKGFENAEGR
jgi:hypothetical protein